MLRIDINKKDIKGTPIIKDIHISLNDGEMLLVCSPSGCGKSTFMRCVLGDTSYTGSVRSDSSCKIAYVSQNLTVNGQESVYNAVYYTVLMDYRKVPKDEIRIMTNQMISALGLTEVANHKISELSGGQCKRVQIAEALVRKSDTILFDEPDSALDVSTSYTLTKDIREIVKRNKKKAIVISHNVNKENIELYDQVLVLAKDQNNIGTIAYYGKPCFLNSYFKETSMLQVMLNLQTKEERGKGYGSYYTELYQKLSRSQKNYLISQVQTTCRERE